MITPARGSPPTKGESGTCLQQARPQIKNTTPALSYPSPETVKGAVLADLLRGDRLSHLDVWQRHGSSRASHHVLMLRRSGFPVITEDVDVSTSDGRIARIALYSLPAEAIAEAGERGQRYAAECALVEAARRAS